MLTVSKLLELLEEKRAELAAAKWLMQHEAQSCRLILSKTNDRVLYWMDRAEEAEAELQRRIIESWPQAPATPPAEEAKTYTMS